MGVIPDDSKQRNALAGIVFCAVVVYFAHSMWYSGAKEALVAQQSRLENIQTQNSGGPDVGHRRRT